MTMYPSNPAPLQQAPQRRRRSDRYLEQEQPPVAQQPAAPTPAQPAAPSSFQPNSPRQTRQAAGGQPQPMHSARQARQTTSMASPQSMAGMQQQQQPTNMAAPQPMPQSMNSMRQARQTTSMMSPQPMAGMQQQPQPTNMAAPQPMPQSMHSARQARQTTSMMPPQSMAGMQQQPQPTNMAAPQPMPQPMTGMQQPWQAPASMPVTQMPGGVPQQPAPRMAMNGQPAPSPQPAGYSWNGMSQNVYYGQPQQPYYGQQGYAQGMMPVHPEPAPDDSQMMPEPIDRPSGRSLFSRFDGHDGPPPRRFWEIAAIAVVLLALVIGGAFGIRAAVREQKVRSYVSAYDARFCEGVYVDGIHLGGMTQQEGISVVTAQAQQRNNNWYVRLTYQGQTVVEMDAATLGMRVDVIDVLREAWEQGHASNDVHERQAAMQQLLEEPFSAYTAVPSGDTSVVDAVLEDLRGKVYRAPQDAVLVEFDPAKTNPFTVQEEVVGMMLNTDSLKQEIYQMVATMESGELEIHPEPIMPNVTAAQIRESVALRADEYTEIHTSSTKNRNENIKRAFELISGTVLKPGDIFSFNTVVGKRTIERGFYSAVEYQYGNEVEGIGGGVCQASTTMYLAAVAANLEITKHTPHSMAVRYTTFGKDATVNMDGKQIDFAFRNNTDGNIYICAAVQYDRSISKYSIARVRIYGPSLGEGVTYKLEAEEIELIPKPEDEIRKDTKGDYVIYTDEEYEYSAGREGHVTQSYKVKYVNGVEVERTNLYKDTYKAAPRVVYVGVEERWMY